MPSCSLWLTTSPNSAGGLYSYDQECGRGQHEFDFGFTNALSMTDQFVFLRFMAKKVAESIGAIATFMPKPYSGDFRSGAHFNMSLADVETGVNLFDPAFGGGTKFADNYNALMSGLAYHCTAGVLNHARSTRICWSRRPWEQSSKRSF